jgi:predicted RNA-binding protein with PIN domain
MPTHLLVDGYNLLGSTDMSRPQRSDHLDAARESLIMKLAGYRQRKAHAVTVVFDGWQGGMGTEQREFRSGVEVIYSRRGERADQVIERLVRGYGGDCAVVSSDHEVMHAARSAGAFVLGAGEFRAKLGDRPSVASPMSYKELDHADERSERNRRPDKRGNPKKLPKAQRKRRQQLREF